MNTSYKVIFWTLIAILLLNIVLLLDIVGYQIPIFSDTWWYLYTGLIAFFVGGPLWIAFVAYSIVLLVRKRADRIDKRLFIAFCILSLLVIVIYLYDTYRPIDVPSLIEQNPEFKDYIQNQKNNRY